MITTAIENDEHFIRCLVYIDLNMVRAGAVSHPYDWNHSGYREIQRPPERYSIIIQTELIHTSGLNDLVQFQEAHRQWVANELAKDALGREHIWTESIAVGHKDYVKNMQAVLGIRAKDRQCTGEGDTHQLRESAAAYTICFEDEKAWLSQEISGLWG